MCTTCGCSDDARATLTDPATGRTWTLTALAPDAPSSLRAGLHGAAHAHDHAHAHAHGPGHPRPGHAHHHGHPRAHAPAAAGPEGALAGAHATPRGTTVSLDEPVLAANDRLAERNRGWLAGRDALAINLLGAPGAGKTALLERTAVALAAEAALAVIEGDQATSRDAERLHAAGCASVQLNTGPGCHLEADMVTGALRRLDPAPGSLVLIENVGNLVCPALFDLGEHDKVVVLSVTEGDDKPLKYPHVFHAAALLVINKTDLLPHVSFDPEACVANARAVHPGIEVLQVSATTGEGMEAWYDWLRARLATRPGRDRLRA